MERALYTDLIAWKSSSRRKPLLLRGARQTGKTFLLQEFGKSEYDQVVYCNFEEDPALDSFFKRDLNPHRIVEELSLYKGINIQPQNHLVIFDEIQASNLALNSLKYFQERANDFHISAAGSLLGVKMSRPGSFPVGKVNFLDLHPMSFLEFLTALGKPEYAELLSSRSEPEPLPTAIHMEMISLLRKYYVVGGMPEPVQHYVDTGDVGATREIHHEILDSYVLDFAKHAPTSDIPKLNLLWDSLPKHLARENKKFMFSMVRKGARAREYENALRWLHDAGIALPCHAVTSNRPPLSHYADRGCFKVYVMDVGILGAMAHLRPEIMVQGDRLFTEYRGALVENYVAQQLTAMGHSDLFYWRSRGGKAELDFLYETADGVVPIEVKSGLSRKSKSLRSYDHQFAPSQLVRTNLLNLKRDGKICNIPLYAVSLLPSLLNWGQTQGSNPA